MRQLRTRAMGARRFVVELGLALTMTTQALGQSARPMPDTSDGIHVFNDQINSGLTQAQVDFAARRYAGTQKLTVSDSKRLRAVNPDFLVLHCRLGMGLGYREITGPCQANGAYSSVIDGDSWVQEWPGDSVVEEPWFFHWNGQRVMQCQWGWYLMDVDDPSWRLWWSSQVLTQLAHNDSDGLFADSFMVPNYLGGFSPSLPVVDATFESTWSAKLEGFTSYVRDRFAGQYWFIANVGKWVTTRDQTDFHLADGVFVEEFGYDTWAQHGLAGFKTQSDRMLSLIAEDKIVIGQSYRLDTPLQRMSSVANYLLLKGEHVFLNLERGQAPEWWPEYDIPIGEPLSPPPPSTAAIYDAARDVYVRDYSNGRVILNASNLARTVPLGTTLYRARPSGGGDVPLDGVLPGSWLVSYPAVSSVVLLPGEGALLLVDPTPHRLDVPILRAGQPATLRVSGATPGWRQYFFIGPAVGSTPFATLGVTLGVTQPRLVARRDANANGDAAWTFVPTATAIGSTLHVQVAEVGHATNVAHERVH